MSAPVNCNEDSEATVLTGRYLALWVAASAIRERRCAWKGRIVPLPVIALVRAVVPTPLQEVTEYFLEIDVNELGESFNGL